MARRNLDSKRRRVAVFLPIDSSYSDRIIEGILQYRSDNPRIELNEFRYDVRSANAHEFIGKTPPWSMWKPDGLIVMVNPDKTLVEWLRRDNVPIVSVSSSCRRYFHSVHVSPGSVAKMAVRHLLEAGYRHFLYASGLMKEHDPFSDCMRSELIRFDHTLEEFRISTPPINAEFLAESNFSADPALQDFIKRLQYPVGVFCVSDLIARILCQCARIMKIEIPREFGVLGLGNLPLARTCTPAVSSIHVPGERIGYKAMQLLTDLIYGGDAPRLIEVEAEFIACRESTGGRKGTVEVTSVVEAIRQRACEGISIDEILNEFLISRSKLDRDIKEMLGHTAAHELLICRLNRAKELLRNTNLKVQHISKVVGYPKSSVFCRFFKSHCGCSPGKYRANMRDRFTESDSRSQN